MRRELVLIIVLGIIIMLLLPWSIARWKQAEGQGEDILIRVRLPDGAIEKQSIEKYLIGVVAAEMPAEFLDEALKAQAVAARTYAVKKLSRDPDVDPGFDVDTTVLTQAWLTNSQMLSKWGIISYWKYYDKIKKAVGATKNQVMTYNGTQIDALYHSSSGRKPTERSEEVWRSAQDYFVNVSSCEEVPLRFVKQNSFTVQELYAKLNIGMEPKPLTAKDFRTVSKTAADRVKTVLFLGKTYAATEIRSALGLASTDWEVSVKAEGVTFTTYGNGHAVGMSQYGANDLAARGYSYQEILGHYYQGVKFESIKQ